MNILDPQSLPSNPGEPSYFTGAVTLKRMAIGPDVAPNKVLRVEFSPGARTNWHSHTGVQILFVAEGRCRFQQWGGPVQEAGVGETIFIPAGEKHWHGATPEAPMVHVALNIDFETEWLEPVSDEQYAPQEDIRRAQAIIRSYIPEGSSLSDEIIADRRRDSKLE